jgi:hypothetical protein
MKVHIELRDVAGIADLSTRLQALATLATTTIPGRCTDPGSPASRFIFDDDGKLLGEVLIIP